MDPETLLMALQVSSILFALYLCLCDLLLLLGRGLQRGIEGGPDALPRNRGDGEFDEVAAKLEALGFEPAGVYWEKMPAHRTFREYAFASKSKDCYALVYRLFLNDPLRTSFLTTFTDGAAVFTQNYVGGLEADAEDLRVGGAAIELDDNETDRVDLEETLDEHRLRIRRFGLKGHTPMEGHTIQDFYEAECVYSDHPVIAGSMRSNSQFMLGVKLLFFASIPGIIACYRGLEHPAVWTALLLQCCVVWFFRRYSMEPAAESCDSKG